ncbi:MAG TPA: Stp1/IreP family PP2C-type Ser/Thr phosphatase [Candidatus Merdenecus merdavium]|nr:Stp1/IreP family PP2C-type Ser/Thr phosphatase [Candidatus Merdenecus merdavium]
MNAFSVTDIGQKRSVNQDYVFVSETPIGNLPNLFIVADGMGGHKAGDFASRTAVESVIESIKEDSEANPIKLIQGAITKANQTLYQKAKEETGMEGMGTTMVVSTMIDYYMYIANVGDSRLYMVEKDKIDQITIDHSLVEEMVRIGEISPEQARLHPDKNIITRAIGVSKEIHADFFDIRLAEDCTILMCSDGLSNMVEDEDIKDIINSGMELSSIGTELIKKANQNGGKDNIAVILIQPDTDEVERC